MEEIKLTPTEEYHIEVENNNTYHELLTITVTKNKAILDKHKQRLARYKDSKRLEILRSLIINDWCDYEPNYNILVDKYKDYSKYDRKRYKTEIKQLSSIAHEYLFLIDTIDRLLTR